MFDPIRQILGWQEPRGLRRVARSDTEMIEFRDRVEFAASLIRDHELRCWFERDWQIAALIQERCPECAVVSIPTGALWLDELDRPPPWRRAHRKDGTL